MTPVEATSTCSTGQPTTRAVSSAISRATFIPSLPVQAFAHPLLMTIARVEPCERARCSRDTTTGAACTRFVVKTAAAVAGTSETRSARSSGCPFELPSCRLIPALTPAARNPCGVVTPPRRVTLVRGGLRLLRRRSAPHQAVQVLRRFRRL
jgi:hypothetical protein